MPGGRRNAANRNTTNKTQNNCPLMCNSSTQSNSGDKIHNDKTDDKKSDDSNERLLAPKHIPIPSVPADEQLTFETMSFITSIVAVSMQILNLYRTVWWLPTSHNNYSLNFYLLDPHLLIFIITMIKRRFIYAVLRYIIDISLPTKWIQIAQTIMRTILLIAIISILLWCLYHMAENYNSMKIFYLCYPSLSVYFLMFGANAGPFFDISTAAYHIKEDKKIKLLFDKPWHNCSLNASAIRAEVTALRADFNRRLKRALFASSASAYVCGIAPIIFVPAYLHFNVQWVIQHVVLFWFGRITAHFVQAYPVRYCDVLHRAALHLGRWNKIESRGIHIHAQAWNESFLWPSGSIVKYNKEFYRSEGQCTTAEPGNPNHHRFYVLFQNPSILFCSLLCFQLLIVGSQIFILIRTSEWYQIISMSMLLMVNYYTLFKATRDYVVSWKIYRAEEILQEKNQILTG